MLAEIKNKHEHYFVDDQFRRQGEYKEWYLNRQIFRHCVYVDNKLHGEYKSWLTNGRMWRNCFYIDNEMFSFRTIPYPKTEEDLFYFKLKYDLQLLPVEDNSKDHIYKQNKVSN